ncbi:MAG: AAA family ATPase, partial [Treponema sp.]|nr:AAA family ATPase [Treponema sp.]
HNTREPLAARMRPRTLDEYIGQDHIGGKGRLLRRAIAADQLSSVIFYGPPGSGKTTLARVIANHTKSNFITLNAVLTGVADIRSSIKSAEDFFSLYSRKTILFVDEVHRWNKAQQDALLPWVENGTIILIGATTENPFFEVNKALVSRSRVFQLKALSKDDLLKAAQQALNDAERGYGHYNVQFEKGALEHLIETANGDARSLLNALELAVETTPDEWNPSADPPVPAWGSTIYISEEVAEESIQKKVVLYDRDGDYHYDIISAFIKSLRGRDPDAALYWLARMVAAGEDANFIFRRMLISACEDTGLADPFAISVIASCAEAFDRVGMPEGRYFLSHATLYLATSPKSNSSMAFFDALSAVKKEDAEVPNHLKDASRDAEGFGHGQGYMYPHAYRDHWVSQQYLPDALVGRVFYTPTTQGYEKTIRDDVLSRREIQIANLLENRISKETNSANEEKKQSTQAQNQNINEWWNPKSSGEQLTFSPENKAKNTAIARADKLWRERIDSNKAEVLLDIRNKIIEKANLVRHCRSLVWNADDGLLLWEVMRRCPEGVTCGLCRTIDGKNILEQYGRTLDSLDKPILQFRKSNAFSDLLESKNFSDIILKFSYDGVIFDRLFFYNPFVSKESISFLARSIFDVSSKTNINAKKENVTRNFAFTNSSENILNEEYVAKNLLPEDFCIVIAQRIPSNAQFISDIIENQVLGLKIESQYKELLEKMRNVEKSFFADSANPLFNWNEQSIENEFEKYGFSVHSEIMQFIEKRQLHIEEIEKWFSPDASSYGAILSKELGSNSVQKIVNLLTSASSRSIFNWKTSFAFFVIKAMK